MRNRIDAMIGAIAGDIIGQPYEFRGVDEQHFKFFDRQCQYTDDTVLTMAVADWLCHPGSSLQDYLLLYGRKYDWIGYGGMFLRWCRSSTPRPYNSFGNGSAMRVSAVACWANSIEEAMALARKSAMPTHNHPEGIKGAQAIAVATLMARLGQPKEQIKSKLLELFDYDLNRPYLDLYNADYVFDVTCQGTVPAALICFFESISYEDCLFKAVLTNKDTDTAAAVAGAVAGAFYGVPVKIRQQALSRLPKEFIDVIQRFEACLPAPEHPAGEQP
ncbi:MAG: ADP-ribosylglycohydrolase family protein [Prevotella sp.]|nr:ADP-ribosylglycohydrolase family protein [Prevotella sp.]